jgi:DNA-binding CsgD family transcriptional regulator
MNKTPQFAGFFCYFVSMRYLLFLFIILNASYGWSINSKKSFLELDELLFTNLDSAHQILIQLDAKQKLFSQRERGELHSKWGIYHALSGNNEQALVSFWDAYALTGKGSLERASMLKNLANVYKASANYKETDKMLTAALAIYHSRGKRLDELIVQGELAASAYYQLKWDKAISLNLKVISALEKLGDKKFLAMQRQRLANIYYSLERFDQAIQVYDAIMPYYDQQKTEQLNSGYIRISLGDCYFGLGNYKRAAAYYQAASDRLINTDQGKYWLAQSKLAQAFLEQGIRYKGLPLMKRAYLAAKNIPLPNLDELLSNLVKQSANQLKEIQFIKVELNYLFTLKNQGHPFNTITWAALLEQASRFYNKLGLYKEQSMVLKELRQTDLLLNKELQREKSERLLEREASKQEKLKAQTLQTSIKYFKTLQWIWALSIAFLLAISGFLYYYYTAKVKDQKIHNLKLKLQNVDLEERLELEHKNMLLEQELHAVKERELTALSLQFYQLQESLSSELKKMESNTDDQQLKNLNKCLKSAIGQKDYWREFELKFTQLNPDFHQKLLKDHPSLTKKDLDFCSLVRLNLGNKEIASLTQIAYESVISKKYKLRKKLGFLTDNELFVYLQGL